MSINQNNSPEDRRRSKRHNAKLNVNYKQGDTYLFCQSTNLSELGIYLSTASPLAIGTKLELSFEEPDDGSTFHVTGKVVWTLPAGNAEEGMGIQFIELSEENKARIKSLIRTIAYL